MPSGWAAAWPALRLESLAAWNRQASCQIIPHPPVLQLTNAQLGRVKSITGADFTDVVFRKDVMMGLCRIAGATEAGGDPLIRGTRH